MTRTPTAEEELSGAARKTYVSTETNLTKEEVIKKITAPSARCVAVGNVWGNDLVPNSQQWNYPTEKPEALIQIPVEAATDVGDIVLDCFVGSGTTAAVSQKSGRRWIGCDINKGSIQVTSQRLQSIISEQEEVSTGRLTAEDGTAQPAQLSFTGHKVNDYDLHIQHNEAVILALECIGVTTTLKDAFFDGTRGKELVKVIPFDHPLSPLDLEEVKSELKTRPTEDRDVLLVCLGKEIASDAWLEEYNKLRKTSVPNKIRVIELKTDPKYKGFFIHTPPEAKVTVSADDGKNVIVKVHDFVSYSVIERLKQQGGPLTPEPADWKSMVDSVSVDVDYTHEVFNIALVDAPVDRKEVVEGYYEIPIKTRKKKFVVAVKIVDVLGEEVLKTFDISREAKVGKR